MAKNVMIYNLSDPLNAARVARFDIHAGDGNLTIDGSIGDEQMLASGRLEYSEKQGMPSHRLEARSGEAVLAIHGNKDVQPRFRFPWSEFSGATNWLIHLNPEVSSEITARSNGGNIKLILSDLNVTRLSTDTGGGNIEMVLPDRSTQLSVNAKTGAGNVILSIPNGVAARIRATTGLGKVIVDPRFSQVDKAIYQSANYESADRKVEIMVSSGAGNVNVNTTGQM